MLPRAPRTQPVIRAAAALGAARRREREEHFLNETLAVELRAGKLPGAQQREIEIEDKRATLSLEVVSS